MQLGETRPFASVMAIFPGYHRAMPEKDCTDGIHSNRLRAARGNAPR